MTTLVLSPEEAKDVLAALSAASLRVQSVSSRLEESHAKISDVVGRHRQASEAVVDPVKRWFDAHTSR